MKKKLLIEKLAKARADYGVLLAEAATAADPVTHLAICDVAETELKAVEVELAAIESLEAKAKANATRIPATAHLNAEDRPFAGFGEFLQAVRRSNPETGVIDPRLHQRLAGTGSNETVGSEGGFLVTTDFSAELLKRSYDTGVLARKCKRIPISSGANGVKINGIDETSRATGSRYGGVRAFWAAEAATVASAVPKFRRVELELKKLFTLWYATEELLADAAAMEAEAMDAVSGEMAFVLDDSIFRGSGAGQPRGVFGDAGIFVSVAKETSQVANTIVAANVATMMGRLWAPSIPKAEWFMNQDCWSQLPLMSIANQPVYTPPGGFSTSPFGTLLGRPINLIEHSETLGTQGDIALLDLSQYILAEKGGIKQQSSMHVRFLFDEMVFKFTQRVDGRSKWHSSLTPFKGTATQSPFVFLDTRA